MDNANEIKTSEGAYKYLVGVVFKKALQVYYFGTNDENIQINMPVVVETARGIELGFSKTDKKSIDEVELSTEIKPILRIATDEDLKNYQQNEELAEKAHEICLKNISTLNLGMHLISTEYILDCSKVIFTYVADERVDFRELLKILAQKLRCRIELRQIGARDRSKSVGGLGPCGLPLCCSTFLSDFEGISINMAKNQLLALNIQKLSGQCGKLICCLKYEDEYYSILKKGLPKLGQKLTYKKNEYRVTSINVLTKTMKLENREENFNISFDTYFEGKENAEKE